MMQSPAFVSWGVAVDMLIESLPVQDAFATGLQVNEMPDYVRMNFWAENDAGKVIVARVVMTVAGYHKWIVALNAVPRLLC